MKTENELSIFRSIKVRNLIYFGLFIGIIFVGVGGTCGRAVGWVGREIMEHRLETGDRRWGVFKWCTNGLPWVSDIEKLLDDKTYMVLLQNNNELRPTGGFAGSYARIKTDKKGIQEILVQDIYVPDGQIAGHVEPPYPIQEAFGQGWWKLRDANWDPDFASAAATIKWFLGQGGEEKVDGVAAVNLELVKKVLGVTGDMRLVTYDETVGADNLNQLAQKYAEEKKDKRSFLGTVGAAMVERVKAAGWRQKMSLVRLIWEELERGEVLVWFEDRDFQKEAEFRGWAGRLDQGWDRRSDYLYVVESNLGANKANCCVQRRVIQEVEDNKEKVIIEWRNDNRYANPRPPEAWGGDYIDYVRVVVPAEDEIQAVRVGDRELRRAMGEDLAGPSSLRRGRSEDMYAIEERGDVQIIGFWAVVPAGQTIVAELSYEVAERLSDLGEYRILVKKQPGIGGLPYRLIVDGKVVAEEILDREKEFVYGPGGRN